MTNSPLTVRLLVLAATLATIAGWAAAPDRVLPDSSGHYNAVETQRIRFDIAPLLQSANDAIARRDDAAAIRMFEAVLKKDPGNNPAKRSLIILYDQAERYADGIALCDDLIRNYPDFLEAWQAKGNLETKKGRDDLAVACWEHILKQAPDDYPQRRAGLISSAISYARLGRHAQAHQAYAQALAIDFDAASALDDFYILKTLNEAETGRPALERILTLSPPTSIKLMALCELAQLDRQANRTSDFAKRLDALIRENAGAARTPAASLTLGLAFQKWNMPGPALDFLNEIKDPGVLSPAQQLSCYRNRAYLNFDQHQYTNALADAAKALALKSEADMALIRLKALAALGNYTNCEQEATALLAPAQKTMRLSGPERAQALLVIGRCRNQQGHYDAARAALTEAMEQDASLAEAFYLRGLAYRALGKSTEALSDHQHYLQLQPNPSAAFWGDLGQQEGVLKHYEQGVQALDRSLAYHSVDVGMLRDQGYQYMKWISPFQGTNNSIFGRWNHNAEAKASFRRAIDYYADLVPRVPTNEIDTYRNGEIAAKQEYTKLDRILGFQAYLSRTDYDFPTNVGIPAVEGALPSQGGVELSLRPPIFGFRDEKTLELFGDVLGNFKRRTWSPDPDSYQGMVGARYRPFSKVNYNMSFARLLKIGDNSEDNWLWRNLASWEYGEKPAAAKLVGLNVKLFGDVGYYFEPRVRWYGYFDGRLGPAWQICRNLTLVIPQALGILRFETNNDPPNTGSYAIGGLGGTLRIFEPERKYYIDRIYVDLFAYYTVGAFQTTPDGFDGRSFNGPLFGVNLVK